MVCLVKATALIVIAEIDNLMHLWFTCNHISNACIFFVQMKDASSVPNKGGISK